MALLGEIKRRKMFQVAALYGVTAWLLVQVVTSVETPLNLPEWVDTFVILVLAIGFPITLIMSWAFNLTPDGLVRDEGEAAQPTGDSRKIEYVLIGLLGVAVAWLLYRDIDGGTPPAVATVDTEEAANIVADAGRDVLPNSLAVLLCDNFSTDPENDFFAASLHEEMLNQLFKLRNLNVISRTSVLQYAVAGAERPPITQIADELRVTSVMECSVAYGDGRIVISAQLIDGDTGVHIWSDRYNREFEDVFGIQADIAMNVANALAVEFSEEEQQAIERRPTESPEAYALYLQALSVSNIDNVKMVGLLEQALSFDPEFAAAHRMKALYHSASLANTTGSNAMDASERERQTELARFHAARAAEIDPSLTWFTMSVGNFFTWRWEGMLAAFEDAPDPLDQTAIWIYSYVGEHAQAIERARRWVELDPRSWQAVWTAGVVHAYAGEWTEAERLHRDAIAIAPAVPVIRSWLAFIEIARDEPDAAATELERAEQLLGRNRSAVFLPELAYSYSRIGRQEDAARIIAEIEAAGDSIEIGTGGWAMVRLAQGDGKGAIEQLELALEKVAEKQIDEGFFNLMNLRMNVSLDPVLEEPEFVRLREQLRGD